MQNLLARMPVPLSQRPAPARLPAATVCPDHCGLECGANHQFVAMLDAYQATGGVARVEEVVELFKSREGPSVGMLAAWIERREVICFEWHADIWLPWFQFHRIELLPHPQLTPVFAELTSVYDAWEMANWFARRNPWLADRSPVSALVSDLPAVLHAARADRFIANG